MSFYGHAEAAAQKILCAFQDTNSLPKPLAQVFIRWKDRPHCRKWSQGINCSSVCNDTRGRRQ
jgi:hypothetical protein